MEKHYIVGSLLADDILSALLFFTARKFLDMYYSRELDVLKDVKWSIGRFYTENGVRYIASFFLAGGFLVAIPEGMSVLSKEFFGGVEIYWNPLFSGAIGYAPIEIMLFFKKKVRRKIKEDKKS
jgi:hypothetical protein